MPTFWYSSRYVLNDDDDFDPMEDVDNTDALTVHVYIYVYVYNICAGLMIHGSDAPPHLFYGGTFFSGRIHTPYRTFSSFIHSEEQLQEQRFLALGKIKKVSFVFVVVVCVFSCVHLVSHIPRLH